jgi:hypothetical protein
LSSNSSPIKKKKERKNTLKKHHVFGKNAPGAPSTTMKTLKKCTIPKKKKNERNTLGVG